MIIFRKFPKLDDMGSRLLLGLLPLIISNNFFAYSLVYIFSKARLSSY